MCTKKLRDEVTPVARFLRRHGGSEDLVVLVDGDPPDFRVWHSGKQTPREIECTLAGGRQ